MPNLVAVPPLAVIAPALVKPPRAVDRPHVLVWVITALIALSGCSDRLRLNALDNQAPEVTLDAARDPDKAPEGATHLVEWSGRDADGRVDHFRVAINPKTLDDDDPAWVVTTDRRWSVLAPRRAGIGAAGRDRTETAPHHEARDFDLIAVQAVDDRGALSTPAVRAFFEDNVAPTVQITSPEPNALVVVPVPTSVTIRFNGIDPDGETGEPVYYKFLLLGPGSEFPIQVALADPDSLRRFYAPDFDGWSVAVHEPGEGGEAVFSGLAPDTRYLFAVVAFDAEGAYSPVFSLSTNMLNMRSVVAEATGPRLTVITDVLSYTSPSGGLPGQTIDLEYPAGTLVHLRWFAQSLPGTRLLEYRWALDPRDLDQELRRPRGGRDLHNWRPWSPDLTSAAIGPFAGGETHDLVIEARDELGFRSRLTVRIHTVAPTFEGELLIVDDARLTPDELQGDCVRPPIGVWPTAAELDTFLYARGNTPWRCYPAGTITPPGLFAGYGFDTLGTRTGSNDATVPLEILNRYRHVIWIVDARSATFTRPGSDPAQPITALRYMSLPGRVNTLAAYIRGGGKVWLLGGGGAQATLLPWNSPINDGGGLTWSNTQGELVTGRFMYDFVHWRSEIQAATAPMFINRFLGRNPAWPGVPNYERTPLQMRLKSFALDPLPPGRTGQSPSVFYRSTIDAEFMSQQNFVIENGESALDSLYRAITFLLPPTPAQRVTMTYYHGEENPPVMFSGFDIWSFTRADCQSLVDFVLQDVWGLTKSVPAEVLVNAAPR
jgi:hypothetical protein